MKKNLLFVMLLGLLAGCGNAREDVEAVDSVCRDSAADSVEVVDVVEDTLQEDAPEASVRVDDSTVVRLSGAWGKAYMNFIKKMNDPSDSCGHIHYPYWRLTYIDDDDIPELVLMGDYYPEGNIIATYHNGKVEWGACLYEGASAVLRSGVVWSYQARMGYGTTRILSLRNGKFTEELTMSLPIFPGYEGEYFSRCGKEITREQADAIMKRFSVGDGVSVDILSDFGKHEVKRSEW